MWAVILWCRCQACVLRLPMCGIRVWYDGLRRAAALAPTVHVLVVRFLRISVPCLDRCFVPRCGAHARMLCSRLLGFACGPTLV